MVEGILFWLSKGVVDFLVGLSFFLVFVLICGLFALVEKIKTSRCKHDGRVSETRACDAICCKCGKNLGFIGTWREKNGKG